MRQDYWEKLAIEGGPAAKRTSFGAGKHHGKLEKQLQAEVIDSDMLFCQLGSMGVSWNGSWARLELIKRAYHYK